MVREGPSHQGTKASKVAFLGSSGKLFTTGFSKHSDRQIAVWSDKDLSQPLKLENIDCSSGILNPVFDHDTNMVYVYGKGDGNIRYYEVLTDSPWASYLSQVISGEPQKGFGVMPKRGVDVSSCELFRFFKLHATKDMVEPISMIVPRKSQSIFQEDIFPDTSAPQPAVSGEDWFGGRDAFPVLMSLRPDSQRKKTNLSRTLPSIMDTREERGRARSPAQISNKNNDRKFLFLSQETNPDYRQVPSGPKNLNISDKLQVRSELLCKVNSKQRGLFENRQNQSTNYIYLPPPLHQTSLINTRYYLFQTQQKESPVKTEKDIKNSLNLGTNLPPHSNNTNNTDFVDNNHNNSIYALKDGRSRPLTNSSTSDPSLKKVVHDQKKLIKNLREQLDGKDKHIKVLEARVELLLRNIPKTNLDLSFELNDQSYA